MSRTEQHFLGNSQKFQSSCFVDHPQNSSLIRPIFDQSDNKYITQPLFTCLMSAIETTE